MMNDRFHCRLNCTVRTSAFLSSFVTKIWHITFLPRDNMNISSFKFFCWAPYFLFLQEWRFGCSRSSKVTDFGTIQKRVYDFLLVRLSILGPILHSFGDIAGFLCPGPHPYFTLILGVFPSHQIATLGSMWAGTLAIRPSNYFRSIPTCMKIIGLPEHRSRTDRRTDRHTLASAITALCVASRGKKATVLSVLS